MKKIVVGEKQNCEYRKTCYGIVKYKDKYLMTYKEQINEYSLPGGGVEGNETFEECIRREFAEEVGFNVLKIAELINVDCFWIRRNGKPMETDAHFFLIKVDIENSFQPTESEHKVVWGDQAFLLENISFPYQQKALEIFFSELDKIDFWA